MAFGKILMILGGLITIVATYVLAFYELFPGSLYGWGIGAWLTVADAFSSGDIFIIIVEIFVVLFLALMFRSLIVGLISIIPIILTISVNFATMGYFGIGLDSWTAMIASVAIGLGIDYTIHFLHKYHWEVDKLKDGQKATVSTMMTTGKAIFFNAIAVIAGFMVLFTSNFPANRDLGGLVSFNMFTSFLAAMIILPALLNIIRPKFIFGKRK